MSHFNSPRGGFGPTHPSRSALMRMVNEAASEMNYGDTQELRWAVVGMRLVAWGTDRFAGASCPLRAAGFERDRHGAWLVRGGWTFDRAFDRLMARYVGLRGPGAISVVEG